MCEKVERLKPTEKTLRRLYFASGNRCAFSKCDRMIIDTDGDFIAQVCHIEAANPGGERFNHNMTNEERRSYENLIILCHEHHIKTDNVNEYTVEKLRGMKRIHESKYKDIVFKMGESTVKDITKKQKIKYPNSMDSINIAMKWRHSSSELKWTLELTGIVLKRLEKLTINHRSVFYAMLERSEGSIILLDEIQSSFNLSDVEMRGYLDILNKYSLISTPELSEDHFGFTCYILGIEGWDIWLDIKEFCDLTKNSLEEMIVNMDFLKLD